MTRGTQRCSICLQAGHVAASCPQQPRPGLLARLRAWWAEVREPFEVPTDWLESQPDTVWPEITQPHQLEPSCTRASRSRSSSR